MERVLTPYTRRLRRSAMVPAVASPVTVLMPGTAADEWILLRRPSTVAAASVSGTADADAGTTRQTFTSLEAAAVNLLPEEAFNLDLPLDFGLIQRFVLPPAEPDELDEMARIQLEKILPYPIEAVSIALQTVRRDETDTVLAVQATHQDRLLNLCQPLTNHGRWPLRVAFHAVAVASGAGNEENTAFLYRESGKVIIGICEDGRLSFAQTLAAATPEDLAVQLPTVLLGAELEGVPTNFQFVRLDDRWPEALPALQMAMGVPVELFRAEPAPEMAPALNAPIQNDLSPPSWRIERERVLKRARLRRNLLLAGAVYLTLLVAAFLVVGVMKFQVHRLDVRLRDAAPQIEKMKASDARWKALAPAIDPSISVAESLYQVCACLPPGDVVRLTLYDQKLNTMEIRGEAPSQAAQDFTEKIKSHPEFRGYQLQPGPLVVLPNGHVQISITGTRK